VRKSLKIITSREGIELKRIKRKQGQTLVEFIFVSLVFIFMLILTMNFILAFVIQEYLSYATFMSARSFQASAENPQIQRENALNTLRNYVPGISQEGGQDTRLAFDSFGANRTLAKIINISIPPAVDGNYGVGGASSEVAIEVEFRVPLLMFPMLGLGEDLTRLTLTAKSFLGREVSQNECQNFFRSFLQKYGDGIPGNTYDINTATYMEDNGC